MTSFALPVSAPSERPTERAWLLILVCWATFALCWTLPNLALLALHTDSTDDTMRLVQVRALLDGAGWYGLHQPRLDPPLGLDSHWSRFVDLPMAAFMLLGGLFLSPQGAELFALIAYPSLLFLLAMVSFVLVASRLVPGVGPIPLIAGFVACLPVLVYFKPLKIDHHNLQMTLALLLLAAAVWSPHKRLAAIGGGVCAAFTPAIGFEALHVLGAVEVMVLGMALFGDEKARRAGTLWFTAQAIAIIPVYLLNTPPGWWMRMGCDALQLNVVAILFLGSAGAAACLHFGARLPILQRALLTGLAGAAAVGFGIWLYPACLAGPNADVDPLAFSLWMNHVEEAEPLLSKLRSDPGFALMCMVFPAFALVFGIVMAARRQLDLPMLVILVTSLVASLIMFSQLRAYTYAALTGALFLTVSACRMFPGDNSIAALKRFSLCAIIPVIVILGVSYLLNPSEAAKPTASTTATHDAAAAKTMLSDEQKCTSRAAFEPLKREKPGLVLGHIDLGPAILLNTGHNAQLAPYHRADHGIVLGMELLRTPVSEAHARLVEADIDYLANCLDLPQGQASVKGMTVLNDATLGNVVVPWLEALPADPEFPGMRFWRVKR
jgi:hypothetical protein